MNRYLTAARQMRPLVWLWTELLALVGVFFLGLFGWLSLPVSSLWMIVLNVLGLAALLALVWLFWWLPSRKLGAAPWAKLVRQPLFWGAVLIALLIGAYIPYKLLWWIPEPPSLMAQAISAVIRFITSAKLFSGAYLWVRSYAALPAESES